MIEQIEYDYDAIRSDVPKMSDEEFWVFYAAACEEDPKVFEIYAEEAKRRREPVY